MDLQSLIEQFVEESAFSLTHYTEKGLALYIDGDSQYKVIILYSPEEYKIYDSFTEETIFGRITITYNQSAQTWEVSTSVAQKNYGPTLYDIAMSIVYPMPLMSDRISVSPDAKDVWDFYFKNRKKEFDINPIKDKNNMFFPAIAKNLVLNHTYTIKNPINYKTLLRKGDDFFSTEFPTKEKKVDAKMKLERAASAYFHLRHGS